MTTNRSSSRNRKARRAAPATETVEAVVAPTVDAAESVSHERWQAEYGYVFRDLRKLLIVSGALFGVIIVLGFFF